MTLLGIGAVVTIVVALSGVMDSFDTTLDASRHEALAGAQQRMTVDLAAPQPAGGTVRRVATAREVGRSQTSLRLPSTLNSAARQRRRRARDGRRRPPGLASDASTREACPPAGPAWASRERAAANLHVAIGDRITVLHPVPTSRGTFRLARTRRHGHGDPHEPAAVRRLREPRRHRRHADSPASSTASPSCPRPAAAPTTSRPSSCASPASPPSRVPRPRPTPSTPAMAQFREILLVTVLIAGAMALLIAFNATAINADERAREHATHVRLRRHRPPRPTRLRRGSARRRRPRHRRRHRRRPPAALVDRQHQHARDHARHRHAHRRRTTHLRARRRRRHRRRGRRAAAHPPPAPPHRHLHHAAESSNDRRGGRTPAVSTPSQRHTHSGRSRCDAGRPPSAGASRGAGDPRRGVPVRPYLRPDPAGHRTAAAPDVPGVPIRPRRRPGRIALPQGSTRAAGRRVASGAHRRRPSRCGQRVPSHGPRAHERVDRRADHRALRDRHTATRMAAAAHADESRDVDRLGSVRRGTRPVHERRRRRNPCRVPAWPSSQR